MSRKLLVWDLELQGAEAGPAGRGVASGTSGISTIRLAWRLTASPCLTVGYLFDRPPLEYDCFRHLKESVTDRACCRYLRRAGTTPRGELSTSASRP